VPDVPSEVQMHEETLVLEGVHEFPVVTSVQIAAISE
jgi:hypothetical protein